MNENATILEGQIRECFGRVVYTHKTHEKQADILLSWNHWLKLLQMILAAASSIGCISIIFGAGQVGAVIGALVSTVLLVINAYTKNYDLAELAQKHKQTASELWQVRETYLSLLTELRMGDKPIDEVIVERDEILKRLSNIYAGAPSTTSRAYAKAQEALKVKEDLTFTDDEIDIFLPKELKRNPKDSAS